MWNIDERSADGTPETGELVRMNPLTVLETFDITQQTNRTIGDISLKLFPFKGFRVDYTLGADNYSCKATSCIRVYRTQVCRPISSRTAT
ncbi:MAG: hypothetical protein IPL27_27930 [Lewinellaceae bacterium]|nr:hypothetical protein [Lewinellaceae bacterium]